MENGNKKVFDDGTLAFLENIKGSSDDVSYDKSLLEEAENYNVELDALEELKAYSDFVSIEQHPDNIVKSDPDVFNRLKDLDVRLTDIVEKLFKKSDRPYIIIQDNKIQFANRTFEQFVGVKKSDEILGKPFLDFVAKDDWNLLAENIGEMLTLGKSLAVKIKTSHNNFYKMNFEAIYLNDRQSFSFILAGERIISKSSLVSGLYDNITGLPSFYLLEDRLQVAINNEQHKDFRLAKNTITLIGINIDNYDEFIKIGQGSYILKKFASNLVMSLRKNYTVARGLRFHFWILMNEFENKNDWDLEIKKIRGVCDEPISGEFEDFELKVSMGVSTYPNQAASAKKLLEQAILSVEKAGKNGDGKVVVYG